MQIFGKIDGSGQHLTFLAAAAPDNTWKPVVNGDIPDILPGYRLGPVRFIGQDDQGNLINSPELVPDTSYQLPYVQERRLAYSVQFPDIYQQIDAIAKGLDAYRQGQPLPADTISWLDARASIKSQYPKAEG